MTRFDNLIPKHKFIVRTVCEEFKVDPELILSNRRDRVIVEARQVVALMFKEFTTLALSQIGTIINKNHCTVIYSCNIIKKRELNNELNINNIRETLQLKLKSKI